MWVLCLISKLVLVFVFQYRIVFKNFVVYLCRAAPKMDVGFFVGTIRLCVQGRGRLSRGSYE